MGARLPGARADARGAPERWVTLLPQIDLLADVAAAPHRILLLTTSDAHVRAARGAGVRTCRLQPPNARRPDVAADFTVATAGECQQIIEDENGVSYRSANPYHQSKYAPG